MTKGKDTADEQAATEDRTVIIGDVVGYVLPGGLYSGQMRPAIITQVIDVGDGIVCSLCVFKANHDDIAGGGGGQIVRDVRHDSSGVQGTWMYREEAAPEWLDGEKVVAAMPAGSTGGAATAAAAGTTDAGGTDEKTSEAGS